MYKPDGALNDLQWLICHKIKPNQNLWRSLTAEDKFWFMISGLKGLKEKTIFFFLSRLKFHVYKTLNPHTYQNLELSF